MDVLRIFLRPIKKRKGLDLKLIIEKILLLTLLLTIPSMGAQFSQVEGYFQRTIRVGENFGRGMLIGGSHF